MAVRDFFLSCEEVDKAVIDRLDNFSFDSVWESLAPPEEAQSRGRKFKEIFRTAVYNYSRYFPLLHFMDFSSSPITGAVNFRDNFEQYLNGEISDAELILIPIMLLQINGNGRSAMRSVMYTEPTMITQSPIYRMLARCRHPWIVELEESGKYSQRSGLYGMYNRDKFLTYFDIAYCTFIRSEREHAKISLPIELYGNIDDLLESAKDRASTIQRTNAIPLNLWGMRRF